MSVPILVYHDIEPRRRLGSLSPTVGQFDAEMQYLKEEGFRSVTLIEVVEGEAEGRCVAITFDDGYEGVCRHALPILLRYGFSATVFIVTRFAGRRARWDLNMRWLGARHMDWASVRELDGAGLTIGSHTASHPNLETLGPSRVEWELSESKRRLEDVLGKPVHVLSYPFGRYNTRVKCSARNAGYRAACTIRPDRGDRGGDPFALGRIPVRSIDRLWDFRAKVRESGPSRLQDWKEAFLSACNRSSLIARRHHDRGEARA